MQELYEQIQDEYQAPIKCVYINIPINKATHMISSHWHRSLEIILPKKNGVKLTIEGKEYFILPGQFFIINSKEIHACQSIDPNKDYEGYAIQIRYPYLKSCCPDIDQRIFINDFDLKTRQHILILLDMIIEESKHDHHFANMALQGYVWLLISHLLRNNCVLKDAYLSTTKNRERITEIITYLDEHYNEIDQIEDLAQKFHLSYSHLAKLFKNNMHLSISQYLTSLRLEKAKEDFLSSDLTITQIAYKHGFSNVKALNKEFKKKYHLTPQQYKKNNHTRK